MIFKHSFSLLLCFFFGLMVIILLRNYNLGSSFFIFFTSIPYYDKLGHFFLMGILAFLAVIALTPLFPNRPFRSTVIILGVVLSLIALEEYSQLFIPTRTFSFKDFACDLLGVLSFGLWGHFLVVKKLKSSK